MKVLFHYPHSHLDTGSPRFLLQLVKLAREHAGVRPLFLAGEPGPLVERLEADGVRVLEDPAVTSLSYRRPLGSLGRLAEKRRLLRELDVDLLHMNQPGWNDDLVFAARTAGIPVILHLHNADPVHPRNLNYRLASRLLVASKALRDAIEGLEPHLGKTEVLHNFTDIEAYASGRTIRSELGIDPERTVVCTVAQLSHRKGIDVLLDVAGALTADRPELLFLVVGPEAVGEPDYADDLRRRVREDGLAESVRFLGSRDDVPDLLASSDLFFLPSRYEPFGLVVIEAMAAGLPVVVSDRGGLPEVVQDPRAGRVVEEYEADAFAAAIRQLLDAPYAELGAMGRAARSSLDGRFDEVTAGERVRRIYRDLAG